MNSNIKKEVSCKTLATVFNAAKERGIDLNKLIEGVPYDLPYLLNNHERIEWNYWAKIYSNSRAYFTPQEFEKMGRDYVKNGSYIEGILAAFILFSSNKLSKTLSKHFFRLGDSDFQCFHHQVEFPYSNRIIVKVFLDDEYEFCPEFFFIAKGVWEQFGIMIGHREFKIDISWIHQGAILDVSWKKEGILFKLKKRGRWLFNIRKAFLDLTDSHEELLNQYNKLEESKQLLQKQTKQLKTANDITKSIRQSRDITKTISAITETFVNDAEFYFAEIKIFKDLDGNKFEIEANAGTNEKNSNTVNQPIIINNEKIGELIIHPILGMDQLECDELLNYLIPIINISIHDSLVLRTVTDYKNNLEAKVEIRTAELKKVQEKLSKTIHLLEDSQQAQNRFFTNISHEFRTPLTLILGPVNQILEQSQNDKVKEEAKLIHRSAKKLNRLANQLLDISRIESGKMKLETIEQNIVPVIREIVSFFQSFAEKKNIKLKFTSDKEKIFLYLDKDKFDKILSNIFSNAIKFTPSDGSVKVEVNLLSPPSEGLGVGQNRLNSNYVEISITDTGIGIPNEQLNKIFDRFYQVDNRLSKEYEGTGVGLSLTKELIELHKGKIFVESEEGKGSIFKILLPLGKEHLSPEEMCEEEFNSEYQNGIENEYIQQNKVDSILELKKSKDVFNLDFINSVDRPSLLIVDDNSDVRKYINNILNNHYNISEAADGEEGFTKSLEQIPDLIISDIMMPKIDGIHLCQSLKSDSRTSHIPIILLTAKATIKDKIEGLETGADSYIMKPFEAEELKSRIKNLLEQRKRLHKHFQDYGIFELDEMRVMPNDKKFIQNALLIINEHISNSSFSVEEFAEGMNISRSLLHKKLSALIGEPPGEFIKRIRLNKAAKLIELKSGNVTEIAFEVGFNDPSYFAACFKKQFGLSPSQYQNKLF